MWCWVRELLGCLLSPFMVTMFLAAACRHAAGFTWAYNCRLYFLSYFPAAEVVSQKVPSEANPKVRNHGEGSVHNILLILSRTTYTGVPRHWAHFVFCYFVTFYSTKIQKFGKCSEIQEICYQIGTRI